MHFVLLHGTMIRRQASRLRELSCALTRIRSSSAFSHRGGFAQKRCRTWIAHLFQKEPEILVNFSRRPLSNGLAEFIGSSLKLALTPPGQTQVVVSIWVKRLDLQCRPELLFSRRQMALREFQDSQ